MKRLLIIPILIHIIQVAFAQDQLSNLLRSKENYESAFQELKGMLQGDVPMNFKRAVFITENAYLDNEHDYKEFDNHIQYLADKCLKIAKQSDLIYDGSDKEEVKKHWSIFYLMTDTVNFYTDSTRFYSTFPYHYDFEDFWGEKDWKKMFVTKLLSTHTGNCHSLPFLYKILGEEIGVKSYLSMAPSHTYIKAWTKKTGWFNTELTSGHFPIDAWIMASGYIHLSAVQNRLYMDTLSLQQSIAVCVTDLAKGFERKFANQNIEFINKCADLALRYYPKYTNALILKAETMKKQFEFLMNKHGAKNPSDIFGYPEAKKIFDNMEKLYFDIYQLGYRPMPKEMYIAWLADLEKEREKYLNKAVMQNIKSSNK